MRNNLRKHKKLLILKTQAMSALSKLKVKQFPSKYPFKQETRNGLEVEYEGPIDDMKPDDFSQEEWDQIPNLKKKTKFIIVYRDGQAK